MDDTIFEKLKGKKIHFHHAEVEDGKVMFSCGPDSHFLDGEKQVLEDIYLESYHKKTVN